MVNLQEAFSKLNMMESGDFELLDQEEKDAMKDFLADDTAEAEDVDIIDPQAEDEEELEDSYVGKIIVQCPVCKSLIYKSEEELAENGDEAQQCPYCFSVEVFDKIGKIVPIEDEVAPEVVPEENPEEATAATSAEVEAEPVMQESLKRRNIKNKKRLKEDLENVTIETEDEIINISAEEKCEGCDEAEAPAGFIDEPVEEEHEEAEVIAPLDDELPEEETPEEGEVDEVDEDSFDEFAESFLRENYSNIKCYKTLKMKDCGNHIIAEGCVTLNNGKKKLTEFRIRPSKFNKNGKGTCLVENLQLSKRTMVGAYITEGLFSKNDHTAASPEYLFKKAVSKFKTANSGNILVSLMTKQGKEMTGTGMKFSDRKEAEAFAKMAKDAGYRVEIGRG